jgi:hypothetical protein
MKGSRIFLAVLLAAAIGAASYYWEEWWKKKEQKPLYGVLVYPKYSIDTQSDIATDIIKAGYKPLPGHVGLPGLRPLSSTTEKAIIVARLGAYQGLNPSQVLLKTTLEFAGQIGLEIAAHKIPVIGTAKDVYDVNDKLHKEGIGLQDITAGFPKKKGRKERYPIRSLNQKKRLSNCSAALQFTFCIKHRYAHTSRVSQ